MSLSYDACCVTRLVKDKLEKKKVVCNKTLSKFRNVRIRRICTTGRKMEKVTHSAPLHFLMLFDYELFLQVSVLIIGAGPTGLGAATRLNQLGSKDWLLIDQVSCRKRCCSCLGDFLCAWVNPLLCRSLTKLVDWHAPMSLLKASCSTWVAT
jgi:hypothetical protein